LRPQQPLLAQAQLSPKIDLTQQQDYVSSVFQAQTLWRKRGFRQVDPGGVLTLIDANGPGMLTHIWITVASPEADHLKKLVLRILGSRNNAERRSSLGDFFGLGLGEYHRWESELLSVGSDKALNSFFFMPFQKHARITVSNEGQQKVMPSISTLTIARTPSLSRAGLSTFTRSSARPAQPWLDFRLAEQW